MKKTVFLFCAALTFLKLAAQPVRTEPFENRFVSALGEMMSGRNELAIKHFEALLVEQPAQADVCFQLARLNETEAAPEAGLPYARLAVKGAPENKWYRTELAEMLSRNGKHAESADNYKILVADAPYGSVLYFDYATELARDEQHAKALKIVQSIEAKVGPLEEISYFKFRLYEKMNQPDLATGELKKLTAAFPLNDKVWLQYGQRLQEQKQVDAALVAFGKALALNPDNEAAQRAIFSLQPATTQSLAAQIEGFITFVQQPAARYGVIMPQISAAVVAWQNAGADSILGRRFEVLADLSIEKFPKEAFAHTLSGQIRVQRGNLLEGRKAFLQAVDLDPKTKLHFENLLLTDLLLMDWKSLAGDGEKAFDRFPNGGTIAYLAGVGQLKVNNLTLAEEYLDLAILLNKKDEMLFSASQSAKGRVIYLGGDAKSAVLLLLEATSSKVAPPEAYDYLGDAYFKLGDMDKAMSSWQKALAAGSLNPDLARKIRERRG